MMRSPDIDLDKEFEATGEITKSYIDRNTGKRFIVGVASGVEEDRDGERVSKRCIESMAKQIATGNVALTSAHQQDWMTTIGKAVEGEHDAKTGELIVKTELPPEGEDAIADKAWNTIHKYGVQLGFSIGGKLRKAYFEKNDLGKRRKVLDEVALRHLCLTERPAYPNSFAEAVAKTFDGDPAEEEFFVEKDDQSTSGQNSKTGDRNAGSNDSGGSMKTEERDDGDDNDGDSKLPKTKDERHLACPNCGHEFAADLPADRDQSGATQEDLDDEDDDNDRRSAKKTAREETDMPLSESLDALRSLVDVEKTDDENEEELVEEVEKAETDDASQIVAKAVLETNERIEALESQLASAFETIAKSHKALVEAVARVPQGRRSVARIPADGLPPATGHNDAPVEKTLKEQVEDAESPTAALKKLNAAHPHYAGMG